MRKKIDIKYLERIFNNISDYAARRTDNKTLNLIKNNMKKIKNLYVDDLSSYGAAMLCSSHNITIDKKFFVFGKNDEIIGFNPTMEKLIVSQLGHELLHSAANHSKFISGFRHIKELNSGLYEGLTQMFTEEIYDYVVSHYTDGYTDLKKIAKIINLTFGEEIVFNDYFKHDDGIKKEYVKMAGLDAFNDLKRIMTDIQKIVISRGKSKYSEYEVDYDMYNHLYFQKLGVLYKKIILDIVIPKINNLNEKQREKYISEILEKFSDAKTTEVEFAKELSNLLSLNEEQLEKEKKDLMNLYNSSLNIKHNFINLSVDNNNEFLQRICIGTDGIIFYITQDNKKIEINDDLLCYKIYIMCHLFTNNNIDNEWWDNLVNSIVSGKQKSVSFNETMHNTLTRRKLLSYLKYHASKSGIIILNDFSECDKQNELEIEFLVKEKNNIINYEDLIKINNRYNMINNELFDKATGKVIKDHFILKCYNFIMLWKSLFSNDLEFSEKGKNMYYDIMKMCLNSYNNDGNLHINDILNKLLSFEDKSAVLLVKKLFANSLNYDIVYNFIREKINNGNLQISKEEVLDENGDLIISNENLEEIRSSIKR